MEIQSFLISTVVGGGLGELLGGAGVLSGVAAPEGGAVIVISTEAIASGIAEILAGFNLCQTAGSNLGDDIRAAEEAKQKERDSETPYVKDNRVPLDKETVLSGGDYNKTKIKVKGATVYKNGDKYYYRDTLHKGKRAHLEVFDKKRKSFR